jgi:hypothetical protein
VNLDTAYILFRPLAVLNGTPLEEDVAMSAVVFFCSDSDPTDLRRINAAGTAYVAFGSSVVTPPTPVTGNFYITRRVGGSAVYA